MLDILTPIEPDTQCLVHGTRQLLCTCDIITFLPLVQLSPLLQKQCAADKTQTCAVVGDLNFALRLPSGGRAMHIISYFALFTFSYHLCHSKTKLLLGVSQ